MIYKLQGFNNSDDIEFEISIYLKFKYYLAENIFYNYAIILEICLN